VNTALTPQQKAVRLAAMQQRSLDSIEAEVRRIVEMPLSRSLTEEEYDAVNYHYVKPELYASGRFKLLPMQARALCEFNETGGLFAPIPVGGGKTLTTLLIADDCYREVLDDIYHKRDTKAVPRAVLLVPPQMLPQLRDRDVAFARNHTRFSCPVYFLGGISKARRLLLARSQRRGLYVIPYSIMSSEGADELLEGIQPSVIIGDEAHNLTGASARGKRFRRYVDTYAPKTCYLSGTLTSKSPMDYHYLAKTSLGKRNFLPNAHVLAEAWSMLIDSNAGNMSEIGAAVPQAGPILPLMHWGQEHFPEEGVTRDLVGFRKAYSLRLRTTPGVVYDPSDGFGGSLLIENREIPKARIEASEGYLALKEHLDNLESAWVTPSGDELEHAMHVWKWRYELEGAGFYNDLYWPDVELIAKRGGLSVRDAENVLEKSRHYHALQQEYAVELRAFLKDSSRSGLDTPKLVGQDMHNHGAANVPRKMFDCWQRWKESDFEGRIDRDSKAVRVCPYKIDACVEAVKELIKTARGGGVIVWYYHQAVGAWATEALQAAGIAAVNCMAGPKWDEYLKDSAAISGQVLCCSLSAHGTGKNLQHGFDTSYYLQWPRAAKLAAQSVGRTHRTGQVSDEVKVVTCHSSEFDRITFAATLNDSAYVSQTIGRQNLMYATYNPVPKQVPYAVLREWGTNARMLGAEALETLGGVVEIVGR
jgi:hypothetical protein